MGESFQNKPVEITPGVPKDVVGLRKSLMDLLKTKMNEGATPYGGTVAAPMDQLQMMASNILSQQMYGQNYGSSPYGGGAGTPGGGFNNRSGFGGGGGGGRQDGGSYNNEDMMNQQNWGGGVMGRGGGAYMRRVLPGDPLPIEGIQPRTRVPGGTWGDPFVGVMSPYHPLYARMLVTNNNQGLMG